MGRPKRGAKSRPVRDTRARLALIEWFAGDASRTKAALAGRLGVEPQLLSQWCRGIARPSAPLREALAALCEIPAVDWLDAEERVAVQHLRDAS